ncbi:HD-GYP domain-containing protein [Streptomyces abikoensis]|uniref:HD-GYP domain-containing protein n=1 Tax=Streptomyces abikoensis TaxID=97398 RepID=UPI0036B7F6AD
MRGVHALAGGAALGALVWTAWRGVAQPGVALAYGALIALGEAARRRSGGGGGVRETAPVGSAGTLAYALLGEVGGEPASHGAAQVVAVVLGATLAGAVGRPPALDRLARRVLNAGFAAVCFQPLHASGALGPRFAHGPYYPLFLLLLLALTALCDAVLAAVLTRARTGGPYGPALREELRALPGIGSAIGATGVVIALAVAVAGLWALPVFCLPMLVTQLSVHRYEAVRATRRQTVASLARATEIAGYTPVGHARRVAALGRAVGRELGLSAADLAVVEEAALMHDIGQLSLLEPVPAGATEPLPTEERRRIALLGGAVVRRTGVPPQVALAVERQADPYRDQPLTARIVRTVNAYDDFAGDPACGPLRALERLRLATAHDHEPRVVEALARVLARGGPHHRTHGSAGEPGLARRTHG